MRWKCRRGMLELDLLLKAFLEQGYQELDGPGQLRFDEMLDYPDAVLLEWFMGRIDPPTRMSHNSLRKFDQPLRVELRPSRILLSVLVSLYSLAVLAWWRVPVSRLARLLLTTLLTGHFFNLYSEHIAATSAASIQALSWDRVRG